MDPGLQAAQIILNAITCGIFFCLGFLYLQGWAYAKREGRTIMTGLTIFWFVIGIHSALNVLGGLENLRGLGDGSMITSLEYVSLISRILILAAAVYLLYATLKRNPTQGLVLPPKGVN